MSVWVSPQVQPLMLYSRQKDKTWAPDRVVLFIFNELKSTTDFLFQGGWGASILGGDGLGSGKLNILGAG